jgi:predicted nucleotidyltransferase
MLSEFFSSKKRIEVLRYVLYKDTIKVTTVSKELSLSKGIKILLNIERIDLLKINKPFIKGIGVYGSWANGTNTVDSDIDIWIKTDKYPDEKELAHLSKILREMTLTDVQLLVLTPEKIEQIKKDTSFFSSLYNGSFLLWGEPIE